MNWQQLLELTQEIEPITILSTVILSLLIVVLTFIQAQISKRTLEEMKISRIQMVSPHLTSNKELVKKGFADAELSYFFDMKVSCNLSPYVDDKSRVEFDIAFHNDGKGAAYNLRIVKINGVSEITADTDINIIDIDSQKQVRFELVTPSDVKIDNIICVRYEDVFGTIYEQEIGVKLG